MLKTIWKEILDTLFPQLCLACNETLRLGEVEVCTSCLAILPELDPFFTSNKGLAQKFLSYIPLAYVGALYDFHANDQVLSMIHKIKYKFKEKGATFLGEYYGRKLMKEENRSYDMIIPIPLHQKKEKERGYNQSAAFGQGLAKSMGVKMICDQLIRVRATESQTGKTKLERLGNVAGAFRLTKSSSIKEKSILLVDDVITTGATVISAGKVLLKNGASKLSVVAIASAL